MLCALSVLLLLLIVLFGNIKSIKEYVRYWILLSKLPTAKGKQFLIGHAGRLFGKSPAETWQIGRLWGRISKPVFTVYLGPSIIHVGVMGPDELEAIYGPMKHLQKAEAYDLLRSWLREGLLTSTGAKWQKRRKILTPAFHFSILLGFVETFNRETENFLKEIESKYLNKPVNIVPLISDYTLLTISDTSMGTKLDFGTTEGLKYKDAVHQIGNVMLRRSITPWLWYQRIFDLTPLRKLESRLLSILHNFTDEIIRNRSKHLKTVTEQPEDDFRKTKLPLLDILLNAKFKDNSIDEKGIREEVDTFMFEGHDTTAMCLNCTTMLLACHRNIQEEVYQEIVSLIGADLSVEPTYNHLQQMTLLERCIKESLRLYPPVPIIGRVLSEDVPTKYGTIPAGATTFSQLYDVHRNPDHWPNPEVFDPSRHLLENSQGRHPYAYIPFSAGPRNCIGQRFAMLEMKAFYAGLLRKCILEPIDTPESIVLCQDMVLRSPNGVKVKFVLRQT